MSTSNTVTKNDLKAILESVSMPKSEKRVLLWTNPSPTAEYGTGNPVSASVAAQYDFIEIEFFLWTGYQYICCTDRIAKGESAITTEVASSNNYAVGSQICPLARSWDFSSANGVSIYGGVQANFASGGTWQTANGVLIPYKIYGVKSGSTDLVTGLGDWTAITLPYYVTEDSVVQVYLMPSNASSAYFMMNKEASSLTFRLNSHSGFSEYGETTVKAGTQLTQSALSNGTVSIRIRPLHS